MLRVISAKAEHAGERLMDGKILFKCDVSGEQHSPIQRIKGETGILEARRDVLA
jgi:hypothetical protein